MSRNLTKAQALASYRRVCKRLGEAPHPEPVEQGGASWPTGPVLCRDYNGYMGRWAVVWEEGPFEWAYDEQYRDERVYCETVNHYALGLYPA